MDHFALDANIQDALRLDTPLTNVPMMRWQRKATEQGMRHLSLTDSQLNQSGLSGPRSGNKKTPGKTPRTPFSPTTRRTPGKSHTPGKPSGNSKTPTHSGSTENSQKNHQDRFIPNRSSTDIENGHFQLVSQNTQDAAESSSNTEFAKCVSDSLGQGGAKESKILSFNQKVAAPVGSHMSNHKVVYSASCSSSTKATKSRQVPQQPDRILDAPELLNDYYLNLLSWSSNNLMAVALGSTVFIWNAETNDIQQLPELEGSRDYVASLSWVQAGNILAVGTSTGSIQVYDVGQDKLIRTMSGHVARVSSLSWNQHILSSGSRSGNIFHHDVRVAQHHVASLNHHTQEVCGLSWSPDGTYLASGANDNLLCIWDSNIADNNTPVHRLTLHQAAVKAVAWCPWQPSILASGAGTADRTVRIWNATNGSCLQSVDTQSQVSSILWNSTYKELITAHGYQRNQLTIWKYPNLTCVTDLVGHQDRILNLAMSPDGSTVASLAADETIRLWKCFAPMAKTKQSTKKKSVKKDLSSLGSLTTIR